MRARGGDRDAFARLAAAQIDRLYATAYLVLGSVEPARDATQDALLAAWRGLPGLRDPESFGPWLHRLLVRGCHRQRHHAGRTLEIDSSGPVLADPASAWLPTVTSLSAGCAACRPSSV